MKLSPSRDGLRVAALDRGRVRVLDVAGTSPEASLITPGAEDLALFEREVWVVAGAPPVLRAIGFDGAELARVALPPGRGLVRAPYGPPAAVWLADPPLVVRGDGGELSATPLELDAGPADLLAPLTAQRVLRAREGRLSLHDGGGARWTYALGADATVTALGALAEGRSCAAVVGRRGADGQHLVVLDVREGRLQQRLALAGVSGAWFTPRRGLAVLAAGPHRLILLDMRFGKVLRHHHEPRAILDVAIDDAGEHLILRLAASAPGDDDDVLALPVPDLIAGRIPGGAPPDADDGAAAVGGPTADAVAPAPVYPDEPAPAPAAPAPAAPPLDHGAPLLALDPRPPVAACRREEVLHLLERQRDVVAALAARAIARGWDSGAIAFIDESRPPFELEVNAIVGGVHGLADDQLRRAEAAVAAASGALRQAEAALGGRVPPLTALAREFRLGTLAQHLLVLVAAPSLWGELARLYGILANDEHRALCDELLLVQLAGPAGDRHAIARCLDRDQPLLRHGLVRVAGERGRPFAALAVDPLVLKILRADPLDTDLDEVTQLVRATRRLDELRAPAAEVARVVRELAVAPTDGPLRLVVRGRIGSGRRTLIAALAARAARPVGAIDVGRLIREKRLEHLAILLRRCALRGWLPLVDGLDAIGSDDAAARETARELLREHPGPLAVRLPHDATPPLVPGFVAIDLPALTIAERSAHWQATLAAAGRRVRDADELAARFHIGPGVIERVVASIVATAPAPAAGAPPEADRAIDQAVRQHLASRLGQVAHRVTRLVNWSQVILPPDIQDSIVELIARIRHRRTVYDTWGFDHVMTTSRGVTALFQGGPGTGKTLVASAIANELGLDLYRVDLSRVMSKWIGETEQNLARVFDAAEEGQAIILFDEADSLFAKRTEVRTSVDRYANLEVNYLLQRLDSFEGIAVLTTNFGTAIDAAFKRRLSFRLTFPFPDDETRELLWKAHLPEHLPRAGEFDLAGLARRYRMSGGYIRNAALRAAFLAAEEHSPLTQDHLERAIRAEFREIGKLADTGVLE